MSKIIKLKDFRERKEKEPLKEKSDAQGQPKKAKSPSSPPLIQTSGARVLVPGLRDEIPKRYIIDPPAQILIEAWRPSKNRARKAEGYIALFHLSAQYTATFDEAEQFARNLECRFARTAEFVDFVIARTPKEEEIQFPIVCLGTKCVDEYGHRQALVYEHDRKAAEEWIYLMFAERIRHDWFLLLVQEIP